MSWLLLLLAGCPGSTVDTGPTLDTGWFTEEPDPECSDTVLSTAPAADATDWYWRSPPVIQVATDDRETYSAELRTGEGDVVPTSPRWVANQLILDLAEPLDADASYELRTTDCRGTTIRPFRTGTLGAPLELPPSELTGRAYDVDIGGARWEEPPGIGALMSLYFSDPVLIGVEWSSPEVLDLLGGQGYRGSGGVTRQYTSQPTWDFPVAEFDTAPFFSASAPSITIEFNDVALIIHDFRLEATFSADGSRMGGGWVSGLGDTRYLGPVLNQGNDPDAACSVTEGFGAECIPCPDGEPYCLPMSARDAEGVWVPGLRLERRED